MKVELHPDAQTEFAAQVEYYDDRQSGLVGRVDEKLVWIHTVWIEQELTETTEIREVSFSVSSVYSCSHLSVSRFSTEYQPSEGPAETR